MQPRWVTVGPDADTERLVKRLSKQAGRQIGVQVRTVTQIAAVDPDTGEAADLAFGLVVGATRTPFDPLKPKSKAPDDPPRLTNPALTNPDLRALVPTPASRPVVPALIPEVSR